MKRDRKFRLFEWSKWILIFIGLVALFVFDDVLYYMLFENLLRWELAWPEKYAVLGFLFLLNILLALAVLSALRRRSVTGREGMIYERGIALSDITQSEGWVLVHSERWRARSAVPISKGEPVRVVGIGPGLQVEVEAYDQPS